MVTQGGIPSVTLTLPAAVGAGLPAVTCYVTYDTLGNPGARWFSVSGPDCMLQYRYPENRWTVTITVEQPNAEVIRAWNAAVVAFY
jgi:hypothetical protein